jgi:catechol 2,3-dioxygenase
MGSRHYGIDAPDPLPADTRLGGITLQVGDLARASDYYASVLGLLPLADTRDWIQLGVTGSHEPLIELRHRPGAKTVPRSGLLGLYHFAILLPNRADLGRLVAHLSARRVPFASADHLVSEAVYLWDPEGLGIEVYADRPRAQWKQRGQELAMSTDPLDLENLIREAPTEPWHGMPAGTVMGHMHLSVGDLATARSVYHMALGFDLMVWGYPGALFFSAGGYHHHLGTNTWAAHSRPAADEDARLLDWSLILPSADAVDRARHRLSAAGYAVAAADRTASLTDPWGTRLRLVA